MRALFLPQVSASELSAESDIAMHRVIMEALDRREPGRYWLWARQMDEGVQIGKADMLYEDPKTLRSFYTLMATADLHRLYELFSWQSGLHPIDAVFTSRAVVAPVIGLALGCGNGLWHPPVVITEPRTYGPGDMTPHNVVTADQMAGRAAGYATCYGLYQSSWDRKQAFDAASLYVQPAVMELWDKRAFVCDFPVGMPDKPPAVADRPMKPKRLIFAGRLNSNKQWQEILEVFGSVMSSRDDVEVWVHAGTGAFSKLHDVTSHRWHATSEKLPYDEYVDLLRQAHVGMYWSRDEGANVTVQELIANGVVMVLPKRPWVEHLFPGMVYPFLASTVTAAKALVDWIVDNFDDAFRQLTPFREWIEQERSFAHFEGQFARLVEALEAHPKPQPYRVYRQMVLESMDEEGVSWTMMRQLNTDYKNSGSAQRRARAALYACYRSVRDLDDLQTADVWLRRPA